MCCTKDSAGSIWPAARNFTPLRNTNNPMNFFIHLQIYIFQYIHQLNEQWLQLDPAAGPQPPCLSAAFLPNWDTFLWGGRGVLRVVRPHMESYERYVAGKAHAAPYITTTIARHRLHSEQQYISAFSSLCTRTHACTRTRMYTHTHAHRRMQTHTQTLDMCAHTGHKGSGKCMDVNHTLRGHNKRGQRWKRTVGRRRGRDPTTNTPHSNCLVIGSGGGVNWCEGGGVRRIGVRSLVPRCISPLWFWTSWAKRATNAAATGR